MGAVSEVISKRRTLINIDHHGSNSRYGDINWIDPSPPAAASHIQAYRQANWKITPSIADCLFTTISTDTGSFQYATTQPSTYQIAAELVEEEQMLYVKRFTKATPFQE